MEPQGTTRSTKRARFIGVALELFHSKIVEMPLQSKLDFCKSCLDGEFYIDFPNDDQNEDGQKRNERGRFLWPWKMLQPMLKILGHCLMGIKKNNNKNKELHEATCRACKSLR